MAVADVKYAATIGPKSIKVEGAFYTAGIILG